MFSERAARCGLRCPRPAAYQSPREGVEIFHARRHPWNAPPSYAVGSRALTAAAHQATSSRRFAASITPAVPATTCATGSRGIRPRHQPSAASWPTCWSGVVTPMSRHRNAEGRPPGGSRPKNAPASADQPPSPGASSALSVTCGGGKSGSGRRGQYPRADASHYEPVTGRGRDRLSIRCPYCAGVHLSRLRPGALPGGPRRTPCGMVWVVARRTYRPRTEASSGAAA